MDKTLANFQAERLAANERILSGGDRVIKRFFRLDAEAYEDSALPAKTKELLGLVASMVLRCDDCITYHVIQCVKCGVTAGRVRGGVRRRARGGRLDRYPAPAPGLCAHGRGVGRGESVGL